MPGDQVEVAGSGGFRGHDVLAVLEGGHLRCDKARNAGPRGHREGKDDRSHAEPNYADDQDREQDVREREHAIGKPHEWVADPLGCQNTKHSHRDAYKQGNELNRKSDGQRYAGSFGKASYDVASQFIRP